MISTATPNEAAFLDMLAGSEGTKGKGNDGYNMIVGGTFFTDYTAHPGVEVWIPRFQIYSSAAGRYQLLKEYFLPYKALIPVPDFSPDSQDLIALQQIKERGAQMAVRTGQFASAISLCCKTWASLPGDPYGQGENSFTRLLSLYQAAGGTVG